MSAIVRERVVEAGAQPIIEQTATFDPSIIVRRSPPPEGFAAHVWMDLSNPAAITMVLLDRTGERGLLRYASRARGDELAQEEMGQVLYQAGRALLAGGKIGIAREEIISRLTPKREEAPTDAEEREERSATTKAEKEIPRVPPAQKEEHAEPHRIFSAHAGFVVHGELFGSAGTNRIGMSSLGFTFDLLARTGPVHVGARFCGEQRFPVEIDAQGFGLRLEMWALRGEAVLSYFFSTFRLVAGAGAGTDVVHLVPSRADAGRSLAPPSIATLGAFRGSVGFFYVTTFRIGVVGTIDVVPSQHYDFLEGQSAKHLFEPLPVRPGAMIEIGTP